MSKLRAKPSVPAVQEAVERFEKSLEALSPDRPELLADWKSLRSGLDEILEKGSPPAISRNLELPVILVATPEIVSLPEHMGNLSNFIGTGDGGGLADISAAVVTELYQRGVNVHVTLPHYRNLFARLGKISDEEYRAMIRGVQEVQRIHFIDYGLFDGAKQVYEERSQLNRLMVLRAIAFQQGILYGLLPTLRSRTDKILVHCNDWMTGLLPSAARSRGIPSLITCHNIFTALETPQSLHERGIDVEPFKEHLYFERHPDSFPSAELNYSLNRVDFLTSGLFAATRINTVSPTFLREVAEDAFAPYDLVPEPVRRVIADRFEEGAASGILNAPMPTADPRVDPMLHRKYGVSEMLRGKQMNKLHFQDQMKLHADPKAPLFFWPHRLVSPQKGVELMLAAIPFIMQESPTAQFAIVANGQMDHVYGCQRLMSAFPGRVSYHSFSRELSQLGKAGADFILCPSLYEPCGIPQVEGPRYGTLPIVRKTGGLADTVETLTSSKGNGFVFREYQVAGLVGGIREALEFYARPVRTRAKILRKIMIDSSQRFNIARTVDQYIDVYEEILGQKVT
jgi:ADP-glucose type glycogen/starch synthase